MRRTLRVAFDRELIGIEFGESGPVDRCDDTWKREVYTGAQTVAARGVRNGSAWAGRVYRTSPGQVHLRLAGASELFWQVRIHFLAICAHLMPRILVTRSRDSLNALAALAWMAARKRRTGRDG